MTTPATEPRHVYCPGCNRKVRVTVTPGPAHGGQASLPDGGDVVCLDFHESCTDGRCPIFDKPGIVMGVRLARSHLREGWKTIRGACSGCGQTADLEVLDREYAHCPLCDTTNPIVVVRMEDDTLVAITGEG